jgi:nucleoside-diphosphate-sugar epimerase
MKKILILGMKGFLGNNLFMHLTSKGYNIIGITKDIRDKEALRPYFEGVEIVINAAGESKKIKDEEACHSTNVLGTKNIIELCTQYHCKLIHLSSTAMKMAYGRSKQESQKLVEDSKIKYTILRLCPIVKLSDPLMKWGRRYPLEHLMVDIEKVIESDFKNKVIDYQQFKNEKSFNLYFPRP